MTFISRYKAEIAGELIERLLQRKEAKLIEAYAAPLAVTVITELPRVPQAVGQRLRSWSRDIVAMYELGADPSKERARNRGQIMSLGRYWDFRVCTL